MNKGCETCYFSKTFVVNNETLYDCTLDTVKELTCFFEGFCYYAPIEDFIIPLPPKEEEENV